jgi:iron complex transport system ATP-binding protein
VSRHCSGQLSKKKSAETNVCSKRLNALGTHTHAQLTGVSAGYGSHLALKTVSLEVQAGQLWAVVGPNGAGKSTLLRVLAGLLAPSAGSVSMAPGAPGKQVAWVPQQPDTSVAFTALEVAMLGLGGRFGLPSAADESVARAALAEVDAAHLVGRRVDQLSGGEARRVWLAKALAQGAPLLLLDEPTAHLDLTHQRLTMQVVRKRVDAGLSAIAVLHDITLAAEVATHALLLREGETVAVGPTAEVLTSERLSACFGVPLQQRLGWWL